MGKVIAKLYMLLMSTGLRKFVRGTDGFLKKCLGRFYDRSIGRIKYKIRYGSILQNVEVSESSFRDLCWHYEESRQGEYTPLVSVIVPNFNHADYLRKRLDSIYGQTYGNYEVILLDDCSTDNSLDIMREYAEKHSENTRLIANESNCGAIFSQWSKGMRASRGELIWIAESDDYCDDNFLEEMIALFRYSSVRLAFARSVFVQEGEQIWSTEEYLCDLDKFRWDKPFYMTAHNMVRFGFALHNMIPNVSSAVFRNIGQIPEEVASICSGMKLSGDWIFYLYMMQGGVVAYTNDTVNYYRIHPRSTSLKIQKEDTYYREFEAVSRYIVQYYGIEEELLEQNLMNLRKHYQNNHPQEDPGVVEQWYRIPEILKEKGARPPHVALACYALRSGGGETYPIYLANEMRSQGYPVTLLNFNIEDEEERIRNLIHPSVPLVTISNRNYIKHVITQLGIDVIHTHQASIDELIANWVIKNPQMCRHVISLHGMYECIAGEDCQRVVGQTIQSCDQYIYIADKNLIPFREAGIEIDDRFVKFPNGVPEVTVHPVERQTLDIAPDDFVFVLASRGLPEKGWKEAIEALGQANRQAGGRLQLVILGDGPVMAEAKRMADEHVHFMGTVDNVSDYFSMGDMGLLPTYFQGESYPLTVAECLKTGRPVMATNIGEVANQIRTPRGEQAGILLELEDGAVNVSRMAEQMVWIAGDAESYRRMCACTAEASEKFDMQGIVRRHYAIYRAAIDGEKHGRAEND